MARKKSVATVVETPAATVEASAPALSAEERLARKASKQAPKSASTKDWTITLTDDYQQELALKYAAANHGESVMKGKKGATRAELEPELIKLIAAAWLDSGRKLPNPKVVTESGQVAFNFVCADTASAFSLKPDQAGRTKTADEHLEDHAVSPEIRRVLATEFTEKKGIEVKVGTDLKEKKPALYTKVIELLLRANEEGIFDEDGEEVCRLSDEELAVLLTNVNEVKVKEGLVERLPAIVKDHTRGQEQAQAQLLAMFQALGAVGGMQWRISQVFVQSPDAAIAGMLSEPATAAVVEAKEQKFTTADNKFEVVVKGDTLSIYRIAEGDQRRHLADKKCVGDGTPAGAAKHAVNTAKLYMRDRTRLTEAISELS